MVINTLLSLMAYNYPPEKLNVYLSDDGGSELVFYAVLEASRFSEYWLPFCRDFNIEPRSPAAYFSTTAPPPPHHSNDYFSIKVSATANPISLQPFSFDLGQIMIALYHYNLIAIVRGNGDKN